jgi:hypothetical protein
MRLEINGADSFNMLILFVFWGKRSSGEMHGFVNGGAEIKKKPQLEGKSGG